jgi:preprotein translocase subunit SecY
MPRYFKNATGSQLLVIGGTSVLIVVSVVIESIAKSTPSW